MCIPPPCTIHCPKCFAWSRYWTVDPKAEKMEALAVPAALQECLTTHSASLALAALLFVVTAPLKVCTIFSQTVASNTNSTHWSCTRDTKSHHQFGTKLSDRSLTTHSANLAFAALLIVRTAPLKVHTPSTQSDRSSQYQSQAAASDIMSDRGFQHEDESLAAFSQLSRWCTSKHQIGKFL